jgi:hypothetical protein
MIRLKDTRYISAFKGMLAVIVVALFTAQLSDKFYQCASIPIQGQQVSLQAHGQSVTHASAFSDSVCHQILLLSLDKRYDLKHIYYLPAAIFCLASLPAGSYMEAYIVSPKVVSRANLLSSLRAPPFI